VIFQEFNHLIVVLGIALGISIFIFVVFLAVRFKKFKKSHSDVHIRDGQGKYEEFDGIFLPLTEINHFRYYYRY
jgi:hypothetical protein